MAISAQILSGGTGPPQIRPGTTIFGQMGQGATGNAQTLVGTATRGGSGQGTTTEGQARAGEIVMAHSLGVQHGSPACAA